MADMFLAVLEMSISVSLVIAVLILCSPLINRRYAVKWKYWIWLLLALRLIFPFSGADVTAVAASWFRPDSRFISETGKSDVDNLLNQAVPQSRIMIEIPTQITTPIEMPSESSKMNITLLDMAAVVWMIGSAAFMLVHLISYFHYKRQALRRGRVIRDNDILRRIFELKRELRIKDSVLAIEYPEAASPMMIGFLEPVLILPEVRYDPEELYFILKHELIHLKRKDVYNKFLLTAANAVHWFNPLVWLMQKEAAVDMELSCDERVTQGAAYEMRKAYTETLLSTLHKKCAKRTVFSTQFYGGKQIMKKRFKNILLRTGKKNGAAVLMCAAMLTVSLGTLVGCSVANESKGDASGQAESGNVEGQTGQFSPEADIRLTDVKVSDTESETLAQPAEQSALSERLVYINRFDGVTLTYDEVEWVLVPGERAAELGITEDDAPSGFSIYNEESVEEDMPLASDCTCTLLDWTSGYGQMQVTLEELKEILAEREGLGIPYHLTAEGNEIIGIVEQYIP